MKAKDYEIREGINSRDGLYYSAKKHLEEQIKMINDSKYDLFNDDEELSLDEAIDKYYETNNRAFVLGFSCELFLKYIIMCKKIEENPDYSLEELWNDRKIITHDFKQLFKEIESKRPGFTSLAFKVMSFNRDTEMVLENNINIYNADYNTKIENTPRKLLLPPFDDSIFSDDVYISALNDKYSKVFVSSRYAMQKTTDVDLYEILGLAKDLSFLSDLCHIQGNTLNIESGTAYIKAMLKNPIIYEDVAKIRTDEEIKELQNLNVVKNSSSLLYNFLTEDIDMNLIRSLSKSSASEEEIFYKIMSLQELGLDIYTKEDKTKKRIIK